MTDRRKILTQLAAGAVTLPAVALDLAAQQPSHVTHAVGSQTECECVRPDGGAYADYFPNVIVQSHQGKKALFYHDLLRGKTVLVNCMSVRNEEQYPVTANLVRVQRLLGEQLGRDVFMYSLTVDPENDTPRVLRAFAEHHGVKSGWNFLTAKADDMQLLRDRLFAHAATHQHGAAPVRDCSMGLVRYGNEAVGLWGSVPAKSDPEWIVKRLAWVQSRPAPTANVFKRRGPTADAPAKPAM
ncbi:MAG TPA: SCO family protein [Pyrinomonadaceae bacterium]|nr:SCO family protein [Pyrinomonadaceae bacterium]